MSIGRVVSRTGRAFTSSFRRGGRCWTDRTLFIRHEVKFRQRLKVGCVIKVLVTLTISLPLLARMLSGGTPNKSQTLRLRVSGLPVNRWRWRFRRRGPRSWMVVRFIAISGGVTPLGPFRRVR